MSLPVNNVKERFVENNLTYKINDADNHFNEPPELYAKYIDPKLKDLAITVETDDSGRRQLLFKGRPEKFHEDASHFQVTYSQDRLNELLGDERVEPGTAAGGTRIPGGLLNRLNPLKSLTHEEQIELVKQFRNQAEAYGNRDLRLALMDEQGIDKALMFPASVLHLEFEFDTDVDAIYANARAFNRWIYEELGYAHLNRMYLPPYLPLADPELALKEVEILIDTGAPIIQIRAGHTHGGRSNPGGGRSPADPIFDAIWSRINEARVPVCSHLSSTDYQKYGADWSENPEDVFGRFDAFQWMMYWGDRPAYEFTAAMILHNFFGRFPNIRILLSEMGTVWVPYTMRKMDHAFLMGRKIKYSDTGRLDRRPSQIFREHFLVAPYPEEQVQRVVAEIGIEPIVFGSDFPHGEGLAFPAQYAGAQLHMLSEDDQRRIMRDNMENFLSGAKVGA
jgi:predicted TIM-barrel fold metal-dependent hydrolase